MQGLIERFMAFLGKLLAWEVETTTPPPIVPVEPKISVSERIVARAKEMLGKEPTPKDEVSDEVACVSSLVAVLKPVIELDESLTYTPFLFNYLRKDLRFTVVLEPEAGDIIVSPTEKKRGHTGIFISKTRIASNNSKTGIWEDNYSYTNWIKTFKGRGLHTYLFRAVS